MEVNHFLKEIYIIRIILDYWYYSCIKSCLSCFVCTIEIINDIHIPYFVNKYDVRFFSGSLSERH